MLHSLFGNEKQSRTPYTLHVISPNYDRRYCDVAKSLINIQFEKNHLRKFRLFFFLRFKIHSGSFGNTKNDQDIDFSNLNS
jgi:hypothetical protein